MKILWLGPENAPFAQILAPLGQLDFAQTPAPFKGYDLVALDGASFQGDFKVLLQQALDSGVSLGCIHIRPEQLDWVVAATGIAPAKPYQGVLLGQLRDKKGWSVSYLPKYDDSLLEFARKAGLDADRLVNESIQGGIKAHWAAIQGQMGDEPAQNNLVPNFSQVPFSIVAIPSKPISVGIDGMKSLNSLQLNFSAELYCYHEDDQRESDYIVIAVLHLKDIVNGNPLDYNKGSRSSCGECWNSWDWYQVFEYGVKVNPVDGQGNAIVQGVTTYSSSPKPFKHGASKMTVQVAPFTIFMKVNNGGTFQDVSFDASYLKVLEPDTLKWFDVSSQDDPGNAVAGVNFNIPLDEALSGQVKDTAQPVYFETIHMFRFPASMGASGKFPIRFMFDLGLNATQRYETGNQCQGGSPHYNHTDTNGGGTVSASSELLDLVALTKLHSSQ